MLKSMSETLQELTLRYSRDLSALQNRCDDDLKQLEQKKFEALKGIRGADRAILEYQEAIRSARQDYDKSVLKAETARDEEKRKTVEARYTADSKNEEKYRNALLAASEEKIALYERADAEHKAALAEASKAKTAQLRYVLEGAAHHAYRAALEAADGEANRLIAEAAKARKQGFNRIIEEETAKNGSIEIEYKAGLARAEKLKELALSAAGRTLTETLQTSPEASAILMDHEKRKLECTRSYTVQKSELERKLREDLARLKS